jgi:hypothetical protein
VIIKRGVLVAAVAGSMLAGGAAGMIVFTPGLVGAQTTTTTPDGTFKSNEDPAHEATESAEREAEEDAGRGGHGHGGVRGGGPNEDAAHEAAETPEHEAAEHAQAPSTTPAPATGTSAAAA